MASKFEFERKFQDNCPLPGRFGQRGADALNERRRVRTARRLMAANRIRGKNFGTDTFGDPAWEMLLLLYLRECAGASSTTPALLSEQDMPKSTAARWLNHLDQQGAIRRDYREEVATEVVELTALGRTSIERYLDALSE